MPNSRLVLAVAIAVTTGTVGCTRYVKVTHPPRVNLTAVPVIGVFEFETVAEAPLAADVTRRFISTMQSSQPGVRVLQLGPEATALKELGFDRWTPAALAALRQKHRVDGMVRGRLEVSNPTPKLSARGLSLASLQARVEVDGSLQAEIHETSSGTMVWSNGANGSWALASGGMNSVVRVNAA